MVMTLLAQKYGDPDHESRHNSYRADDDEAGPSENTPLIRRFPPGPPARGPGTTAVVSVLLLVLVSGVIIGVYLLIVQNSEENILPPVEKPLMLMSRVQWDNESYPLPGLSVQAKQLVAVQTDTRECVTKRDCVELLKEMQQSIGRELPYNFLVSSSGQVFEAMGWRLSPLFPQYRALVLAFIGNFTESRPSSAQMTGAENFFGFSVSQHHLHPSFVILCNDTKYSPKYLHQSLQRYPQWGSASLYV